MTLYEFTGPFLKLSKFFLIKDAEKKCEAYYEYFEEKQHEAWKRTVEQIVKKKKTFPTLAECLELYDIFQEETLTKDCKVCSGSGWVYAKGKIDEVRRANCVHGDRLSKKYAGPTYHGPISFQIKPSQEDLNYRWAKMIMQDQDRFLAGLKFTGPILRKSNPEFFEKIVQYSKEGVGEAFVQKILKIKARDPADYFIKKTKKPLP